MAISTIGTNGIEDGAIVAADIASGAVTQAKIATGVAGTGPAFSAYQGTTQTGVSAGTWTKVAFNSERFDTNSNYDNTTYRFQPTVAGYYLLSAAVCNQTNNSTNGITMQLYKNGSSFQQLGAAVGNANNYAHVSGSIVVQANGSTDYFEIYCYNNDATSFYLGQFSGALVRAS